MEITHQDIKNAVIRSQHCQRNYDLTRSIPQEDVDLIVHAATNCPSKQNVAYYRLHVVTDPDTIKKVHGMTDGFIKNNKTGESTTNSQVLSNLLLIFEMEDFVERNVKTPSARNSQLFKLQKNDINVDDERVFIRDIQMSTGVAAGYANLTASILGYSTGCCACFDGHAIKDLLGIENNIVLMMGIGFKNEELNRRVHPEEDFVFPTFKKQEIQVKYI